MSEATTDETVRVVVPPRRIHLDAQQRIQLDIVLPSKAAVEELGPLYTALRDWSHKVGAIVIAAEADTGAVMPLDVRPVIGPMILEEVDVVRRRLEAHIREHEVLEFTRPSKEEVKAVILREFRDLGEGDPLYPSDIAWKHGMDPDLVEECMDELVREGELDTRNRGSGE